VKKNLTMDRNDTTVEQISCSIRSQNMNGRADEEKILIFVRQCLKLLLVLHGTCGGEGDGGSASRPLETRPSTVVTGKRTAAD